MLIEPISDPGLSLFIPRDVLAIILLDGVGSEDGIRRPSWSVYRLYGFLT